MAALAVVGSSVASVPSAAADVPAPGSFDLITNVDASRLVQVPDGPIAYTVSAENRGPNDVSNVAWVVTVEAARTISNPVCTSIGGAVCPSSLVPVTNRSGDQSFFLTVSLPVDGSLRLTFDSVSTSFPGLYQVRSSVDASGGPGRDLEPQTNASVDNVAIAKTDGVPAANVMTVQNGVSTSDARWGQMLTFETEVANTAFANGAGAQLALPMPTELSPTNPSGLTQPLCVSMAFDPYASPDGDVCDGVSISADGAGGWVADIVSLERFGAFALRYTAVAPEAGASFQALATLAPPAGFVAAEVASLNVRTADEVQIGSYVWIDENGDGIQDPGEPGLAGADLILVADDGYGNGFLAADLYGGPVECVVTGVDGEYFFQDLPPGQYRIQVQPPAGYEASPVQVASNADNNEFDSNIERMSASGIYESGVISLHPGDEPIETSIAASDNLDAALNASGNMTVDFGFVPLPVADAPMEQNPVDVGDDSGSDPSSFEPVVNAEAVPTTTTTPTTSTTTPSSTTTSAPAAAGAAGGPVDPCCEEAASGPSISGRVTLGESNLPLADVVIVLKAPDRGAVDRMLTDERGEYSFANIPPGRYDVVQVQPELYGSASANVISIDHGAVATTDLDFVEVAGRIVGRVTMDETGQSFGGVSITLRGTDLSGQTVERQTSTSLDGTYQFDGLAAGTYEVIQSQPAGYSNGLVEPDNTITVSLKAGTMSLGHNFSEAAPATFSDEDGSPASIEIESAQTTTTSTTMPNEAPPVLPFDDGTDRGWITWAIVALLGLGAAVVNRGVADRRA